MCNTHAAAQVLAYASPLGPLRLRATDRHLTHLDLPPVTGQSRVPLTVLLPPWDAADAILREAADQLDGYFAGQRDHFDLPLAPAGTDFQRRVWQRLRLIPHGQTRTYGQLAAELNQPTASRAVGLANGRNPLPILIPCHRVIGANGNLTGFAGGLRAKQFLLDLESAPAPLIMP